MSDAVYPKPYDLLCQIRSQIDLELDETVLKSGSYSFDLLV
jgi:hypothetical protein